MARKIGRGPMLLAVILATILLSLCSLAGNPSCPPDFDCNSYIAMASDLRSTAHVAPHHAVRILPSLVVHVMGQIGLSVDAGFSLISKGAFFVFGMGVYSFLVVLGAPGLLACGLTIYMVISNWPMVYHLTNIYQACDALTYPLTLAVIVFSLRSSVRGVFICSLVGIFCRQSLFPIGICALAGLYLQNRSRKTLAYLLCLTVSFALLQVLMKADTGLFGILMSGQKSGFSFGKFSRDFWDSRIILLLFPFLPFLVLYYKEATAIIAREKALALGCVVVILQPIVSYDITGAENAQRLALQGIWPLYLIGAYLMTRKPLPVWLQLTTILVPFVIGTHHLGWFQWHWSLVNLPSQRWIVMFFFFCVWAGYLFFQGRETHQRVALVDSP